MPMMMKTPEGMDPGLMEAAEETDAVIGEELAGKVRPFDKPVAPKVMDAFVKAIAAAAKVMGMELQPEKYTEAVTELDPDLVRFVSMLEAAAGDYGAPFPVAVVDLKDSAGLTALTAHLVLVDAQADLAAVLHAAEQLLRERFRIHHATLQLEPPAYARLCTLRGDAACG